MTERWIPVARVADVPTGATFRYRLRIPGCHAADWGEFTHARHEPSKLMGRDTQGREIFVLRGDDCDVADVEYFGTVTDETLSTRTRFKRIQL